MSDEEIIQFSGYEQRSQEILCLIAQEKDGTLNAHRFHRHRRPSSHLFSLLFALLFL